MSTRFGRDSWYLARASLFVLLLFSGAAWAFDTAPYSPLPSGAQWTYLRNGSESIVESVQGTRIINGTLTTVLRTSSGDEAYSVVDVNGIFSYGGAFNTGALRATYVPSAPIKLMDADAALGVAVSSSGSIALNVPDLGSFPFQYTLSSTPQAFETLTVPAGTFAALRLSSVMRVSGTVSGPQGNALVDTTVTTTAWLASGIGSIKTVTSTSDNNGPVVVNTEELTSLNFLPVLTFSSTSADWGSQPADGKPGHILGGPMVTNNSPFTIHLSSAVTGEFALAAGSDCTVLAPGQYCFISTDFRPASVGEKTGTLTITSDAAGSPFVHPLRGIGAGVGIATMTPNSLDFGNQDRGVASAAQPVLLTNAGSAALSISSIQTTGQYAQTNNCGASLAVGSSCQINVTFTPFGTGIVSGSLIIDTLSERLFVSLSGNGVGAAPPVSVSSPRLSFGAQQIGTMSPAQTFTLKNEGNSHLNIYAIGPDLASPLGDFGFTTSCPAVLAAGASCTSSVTFAPTAAGARYGYLSIHTDGSPSGDYLLVFAGIGATGPVDTAPDAFSFPAKTGVMLNTRAESDPVVVTGINAEAPISVTGGSYRIDGGFYNEQPGTILSGQSVVVYIGTGAIPSKTRQATLTIGGVSATFSVTTAATNTDPAGGTYAANLIAGWNLIGYGASGALDVPTFFGDAAKVTTVWKWVASKSNWAFYAPAQSDGGAAYASTRGYDFLTSISGGEGFWVNAKTSFTVQMPAGTPVSSASFQNMAPGWSLIAVGDSPTPSGFNRALSLTPPAEGDIPLNVTTLWAWDNAQNNWYFYAPSLAKDGILPAYVQSKNYLDFGIAALGPSMGFWVNKPAPVP